MWGWSWISAFGDAYTLFPSMVVIAIWLYTAERTWRLVLRWMAFLVAVIGMVVLSKLAFMIWGLGISTIDFIGFSGHATVSAFVWPLFGALAVKALFGLKPGWGVAFGLALAVLVAISRLALQAHSVAEVILGLLLGTLASCWFVARYAESMSHLRSRWPAFVLLLALPALLGARSPTEHWLRLFAKQINGGDGVHTRHTLPDKTGGRPQ